MKHLCKKLFLILAGGLIIAALSFILLEILLRTAGFAAVAGQKFARGRPHGDTRIILCSGDSFVWGVGGKPFPVQLQEILDGRAGPGKYKVYNRGVPGSNSSMAVRALPEQLNLLSPDYVILLTGSSNDWNSLYAQEKIPWIMHSAVFRFYKHLAKTGLSFPCAEYLKSSVSAVSSIPSRLSRVFHRDRKPNPSAGVPENGGCSVRECQDLVAKNPTRLRYRAQLAKAYQKEGKFDKAEEVLLAGYAVSKDERLAGMIIRNYLEEGKKKEAMDFASPLSASPRPGLCAAVARAFDANSAMARADKVLEQCLKNNPMDPELAYEAASHRRNAYGEESARPFYLGAIKLFVSSAPAMADARLRCGVLLESYYYAGDYPALQNLLGGCGNSIPPYSRYLAALSFVATGDSSKAAQNFGAVLEEQPCNENAARGQLNLFVADNNGSQAGEFIGGFSSRCRMSPEFSEFTAGVLEHFGDVGSAARLLSSAKKGEPERLFRLALSSGDFRGAYNVLLADFPKTAPGQYEALLKLARAYNGNQEFRAFVLSRADAASASETDLALAAVLLNLRRDRYTLTAEEFSAASKAMAYSLAGLKKNGKSLLLAYCAADSALGLGDIPAGLKYSALAQSGGMWREAASLEAVLYINAGRYEEARAVQAAMPQKDYDVMILGAEIYARSGQPVQGENLYKKAIKAVPSREDAYLGLARLYADNGRPEKAAAALENGVDAAGSSPELCFEAAKIYHHRLKDFQRAYNNYLKAVTFSPENSEYLAAAAQFLRDNRKTDAGQFLSVRGIGVNPSLPLIKNLAAAGGLSLQDGLKRDIEEAAALVSRRGAKLIVGNYPEHDMPGIRQAASTLKLEFVDFGAIFRRKYRDRSEWVSYDNGHCNSDGYRTMAETYADIILEMDGASRK